MDRPTQRRSHRGARALLLSFVLASLVSTPMLMATGAGAMAPVVSKEQGETPTTGGLRPGPLGLAPAPFVVRGAEPISIQIEKAIVDAQIETQEIVDGVMLDPSGPFVVSWYRETGRLGEQDNIVMAGHLDYWDVGQAVFFNLWKLQQGDVIKVTGEDGVTYEYKVEWIKSFNVEELDKQGVRSIVGKTDDEVLTLITCGGPFDYERGEYLERIVVRAHRVEAPADEA
jgi:LPXTG-site transpeptidase (sortase) family protein